MKAEFGSLFSLAAIVIMAMIQTAKMTNMTKAMTQMQHCAPLPA